MAFLCTRVREPTQQDWDKLVRMMNWLKRTRLECLTLEVYLGTRKTNGKRVVRLIWNIDASFAVHDDMKSHTGAVFTMGKGAIMAISRKQKTNTRSSTEAELVGIDDVISPMLWSRRFAEAQGYEVEMCLMEQDNKSTLKWVANGRASTGKRTRHMAIRYFYITDQVNKKLITATYKPTKEMVGDYMSKPLQGNLMQKHRRAILNLPQLPNKNVGRTEAQTPKRS